MFTAPQSQLSETPSLQRDNEWKVLPNFRQNQKEGGWGNIIFSCSIMIHRFGKSIFSEGFLQHLTQRYINPSHCLWLTPQHCNNNAKYSMARLKASLSLQRTQTCKSLELFCGHSNSLQWEQDRSHWVLSCLRGKLKTNKKSASAGFTLHPWRIYDNTPVQQKWL